MEGWEDPDPDLGKGSEFQGLTKAGLVIKGLGQGLEVFPGQGRLPEGWALELAVRLEGLESGLEIHLYRVDSDRELVLIQEVVTDRPLALVA